MIFEIPISALRTKPTSIYTNFSAKSHIASSTYCRHPCTIDILSTTMCSFCFSFAIQHKSNNMPKSNEDMPSLCGENDDSNSSSDEEAWLEFVDDDDEEIERVLCLFCTIEFKSMPLAMKHVKDIHGVDFHELKSKFNMDQYSFIKMINYIRTHNIGADEIVSADECKWNEEKYLKPISYEPWLTFDYDSLVDGKNVKSEQMQISELTEMVQQKDSLLQQAAADIAQLRTSIHQMLQQQLNKTETETNHKKTLAFHDDGYFETYSHYGIHHDMLSDEVRTCSYRDAILKNEETFKNKIVLDLGCGTSILSMFSSKAGAKKVISVDQSDIIYHAMDIVRKNNFTNIEFVKGRLEDINLPVEKVDIIVSEWMGYFLLFEGMLDSVVYARDHHLAPNGILMPNRCKILLLGHGDERRHQELISYWNNVYGFDMSCLQKEVLRETSIEVCNPKFVLTEPFIIADLDLMTVDVSYSNFTCEFSLNVLTTGKLTSLIGYFDTFFELPNHVEFSTSPHTTATHWKQAVFYLKDAISVSAGDLIKGTFQCRRDPRDARSLVIAIDLFGKTMKYNLN